MQKRTWDAKINAMIGLEGRRDKPVAEVCTEQQLSPSSYSQRRDPLLADTAQAFAAHQPTRTEARLEQENAQLKKLVGELLLECHHSDERLG